MEPTAGMPPDVRRLIEESGPLTAISGQSDGTGGFLALAFHFHKGTLQLRCDDDTDEVIIKVAEADSSAYPAVSDESLVTLVGMAVEYAWEMINHRGYRDAFQLRFTNGEGREETRQFEVLASVMTVGVVTNQPDLPHPS